MDSSSSIVTGTDRFLRSKTPWNCRQICQAIQRLRRAATIPWIKTLLSLSGVFLPSHLSASRISIRSFSPFSQSSRGQMSLWFCPEEQEAAVPTGVAEAAYQLHAMLLGQDLPNLLSHISSDGKGLEVVEVMESQLS